MFSDTDLSLWENLKKTLKPLTRSHSTEPTSFPKRLHVHGVPERTLLMTLDLHGLTVEEAYQTLRRFILVHEKSNSKLITVITGKGSKQKEGLIHKEIKNWLDAPFFKSRIIDTHWLNGGGAIEIHLKRRK